MLKKIYLLMLSLSLIGCATAPGTDTDSSTKPAEVAVTPAAEKPDPLKDLTKTYDLLSNYNDTEARKLIDGAIKTYKDSNDAEGLATAYTVSADYYRFVTNDKYKENAKKHAADAASVEPFPFFLILGASKSPQVNSETKLAETTYQKVITAALAAKNHFKANDNYYRLSVLYFRNGQTKEGCSAVDNALKQFIAGKKLEPDHWVQFDTMHYPSYGDQMVGYKKQMNCK